MIVIINIDLILIFVILIYQLINKIIFLSNYHQWKEQYLLYQISQI
jgi:hypothetical protein